MVQRVKGMTITEVMLALTIVTMVLLGVIGLGTQALQYTDLAKSRTIASTLAQQGADIVRLGEGRCAIMPGDYFVANVADADRAELTVIPGAPACSPNCFRAIPGYPGYERSINVRKLTTAEDEVVSPNPEKYNLVTITVRNTTANTNKQVQVTVESVVAPARL